MLGTQLILLYSDFLTAFIFALEKSDVFDTSLQFPSFQDFNKHFAQDTVFWFLKSSSMFMTFYKLLNTKDFIFSPVQTTFGVYAFLYVSLSSLNLVCMYFLQHAVISAKPHLLFMQNPQNCKPQPYLYIPYILF